MVPRPLSASRPESKQEGGPLRFWLSAALGLLTLGTTPLIGVVFMLPLALLSKIREGLNPILILARLFRLENDEMGGYFLAVILLVGALALLGDLAAASISWYLNRTRKSALVTFVSACLVQLGMFAFAVPLVIEHSSEESRRAEGIFREFNRSFEGVARIGTVTFELQSRYDRTAYNEHPEYGPMYKNLELRIPIFVNRAGTYRIDVAYAYSKEGLAGGGEAEPIMQKLDRGEHLVTAVFVPWGAGKYGYWSPPRTSGRCRVQVFYLATRQEIDEMLNADPGISKGWLKRFEDVDPMDEKSRSEPRLPKFVAKSETVF